MSKWGRGTVLPSVMLVLVAVVLGGCASSAPVAAQFDPTLQRILARSCSRPNLASMPLADDAAAPMEHGPRPQSSKILSARPLQIVSVMSASDALERVVTLNAAARRGDREAQSELLLARQDLTERTLLTMMDVSSVLSELHCENEKGDLIQHRLEAQVADRQRQWTVAGIFTGAAASVASGGLGLSQLDRQANIVNVIGGAMSTVTGFGALSDSYRISYRPNTQLLSDVYAGPERSPTYPWTVWKFLTRPSSGLPGHGAATVREALIEQWRDASLLGKAGSEVEKRRIALVMGEDGVYDADDLSARNEMLDLLESTVSSMNQDISFLLQELQVANLVNQGGFAKSTADLRP